MVLRKKGTGTARDREVNLSWTHVRVPFTQNTRYAVYKCDTQVDIIIISHNNIVRMKHFKEIAFATAGVVMMFAPVSVALAWDHPIPPVHHHPSLDVWQNITQQQQQQINNNYNCDGSNSLNSGTTCVFRSINANVAANVAAMNAPVAVPKVHYYSYYPYYLQW